MRAEMGHVHVRMRRPMGRLALGLAFGQQLLYRLVDSGDLLSFLTEHTNQNLLPQLGARTQRRTPAVMPQTNARGMPSAVVNVGRSW